MTYEQQEWARVKGEPNPYIYERKQGMKIATPPMGWNSWDCYGAAVSGYWSIRGIDPFLRK